MAHTGTAFEFDSESILILAPEDQVRFLGSGILFFYLPAFPTASFLP
jgi:hypothetical protein